MEFDDLARSLGGLFGVVQSGTIRKLLADTKTAAETTYNTYTNTWQSTLAAFPSIPGAANLQWKNASNHAVTFDVSALTAPRSFVFPNFGGNVALVVGASGEIPYNSGLNSYASNPNFSYIDNTLNLKSNNNNNLFKSFYTYSGKDYGALIDKFGVITTGNLSLISSLPYEAKNFQSINNFDEDGSGVANIQFGFVTTASPLGFILNDANIDNYASANGFSCTGYSFYYLDVPNSKKPTAITGSVITINNNDGNTSYTGNLVVGQRVNIDSTNKTTTVSGFRCSATTTNATNAYGYHCQTVTNTTTPANAWAFYSSGATKNYFGGQVGLNQLQPTAQLDIFSANASRIGQIIQLVQNATGDALQIRDYLGAIKAGFTASGGIKTANSVAATTLGNVVRRLQIFDAAGNSLGFIPIYNTIT